MSRHISFILWVTLAVPMAGAQAAPQKASFSSAVSTAQWPLAEIDAQLPADWSEQEFLVIEFRSSTSQRFELGLVSDEGHVSRRIHPLANVWVRAAIPLHFYRTTAQDAAEQVVAVNQPRDSYWLNLETAGQSSLRQVRAISLTMHYPAPSATIEVRRLSLSKTDPGDAVLDGGTPLVDDFGQYRHTDWPNKARALDGLKREWAQESRMLAPRAVLSGCRYGGLPTGKRKATGFFRVEQISNRWWFVDPEGCRFYSLGVVGAGAEPPRTRIVGRGRLFASIPTAAQIQAPGASPDVLRDPVSFYLANQLHRFGDDWATPGAQLTSVRMRGWGLNTAYDPALNDALPRGSSQRQAYVYPLPGWQRGAGAVMGLPDVYSPSFAATVDQDAARLLAPRRDDPWLIGYFLGAAPPWPGHESRLVELVLTGPASAMQKYFKTELARGDTPAARKAVVHAAFRRYLEIVNTTLKRHAPHHLNLGLRFGGAPHEEMLSLVQGFDVLTLSQYDWAPNKGHIDRIHAHRKLPILIGGFHFGVAERGMAAGRVQTLNQTERAVAYSYYVEHAAAHPAIIGTHWNQWIDQPVTGRADGENYNIGWIDVTDRPYPQLVSAARATHARIEAIHSGALAATSRKPRASEFGTPEDSTLPGIADGR